MRGFSKEKLLNNRGLIGAVTEEVILEVVKSCSMPDVSVSVAEVRRAFADYYQSEGCGCCQDTEAHDQAEERLAELLKPDQYDDGSGHDWHKYATKRRG